MNASELLVSCLEREGIEYVFGVPGEENADFVIALAGSDAIKFVLTRHEQGAAFMAEAYGRLTGNPVVCLGTLGPGASNLVTGVANANMDRAPMIVITGQGASTRFHKESHQMMDVVHMMEPITKWSISIREPRSVPEIVRKAVRLSRTEKPGVVHIELPEDIAAAPAEGEPLEPKRYRHSVTSTESLDEIYAALKGARSPVIIAGNGCVRGHATDALRSFCKRTGIGVMSTFMAKGSVPMDEPYNLFTVGLGAQDLGNAAIDEADVVLTVGFDMVEYHPRLWNHNTACTVIHVDSAAAEIDEHYQPDIEAVGDITVALDQLTRRFDLDPDPPVFDTTTRDRIHETLRRDLHAHDDDTQRGTVKPQKVLADCRTVLDPHDILISDVGAHKMWIARHYQAAEPNTCLIPNGFCSMGFALPVAIGAALTHPDRRILAIAGDGGFLMNSQEMETAKRLNSDVTVMVWEDGGYGLIKWKQTDHFGHHTELDFGNPKWPQLADAFGWNCDVVEDSEDLLGVLRSAVDTSGPSLIVVKIDYRENALLTEHLGALTAKS